MTVEEEAQDAFNKSMDDAIKGVILKAMKDDKKFRKYFAYWLKDILREFEITDGKNVSKT